MVSTCSSRHTLTACIIQEKLYCHRFIQGSCQCPPKWRAIICSSTECGCLQQTRPPTAPTAPGCRRWRFTFCWDHPQLLGRMCKEAHPAPTPLPIFAWLRSVAHRMQPAFKDPVRVFTSFTPSAISLSKFRACCARIAIAPRVSATRFLSWMSKRAFRPVVTAAAHTFADFKIEHSEIITSVDIRCRP